jgi:predicted TPR repeat methyltransferase/TolA-binding protein
MGAKPTTRHRASARYRPASRHDTFEPVGQSLCPDSEVYSPSVPASKFIMAANDPGNGNNAGPSPRLKALLSLQQAGRLQEAESGYRECLRDGDAQAAGPLATLLLQQGRDREAAELLEPIVRASPENGEMVVNLSMALRRLGRLDEALQHARRGSLLLPRAVPAWNALGVALLESGRLEEALAAFDSGLKAAPQHPALWLHRAMTLRRMGRNDEALPIFAQLVRAFPQMPEGWRGLADVQGALGQTDAALRSRQQARALAPHDADIAFEHATALLQGGHALEASRLLESLLKTRADHAQGWVWLGRAHLKLDNIPAARTAFERAKALDADDVMIAHFHAATSGTLPAGVETGYIRSLFDDFADGFEHTLVDLLSYDTPAQLARCLQRQGADVGDRVLDLGCGTGLMAVHLARPGRVIDGVDLSPRMLEHARAKGLYSELHTAELIEFLRAARADWDLIVATDVFIYLPDPGASFAPTLARLTPGGWFAFSVETSAGNDAELMPQTGRYRQASARIVRELSDAGFEDIAQESAVLRQESGKPVAGALFVARRPAGPDPLNKE